jgi:hypothetical protein
VDPALNTDARYTKQGVINAVQSAAQNAGVSLQGLETDDSEFPVLVGLTCDQQVYDKLLDELKKLDGYGYSGGVGGSSHHVFNITPLLANPAGASEQVSRRQMLRLQVFYQKVNAQK